MSTWKFWRRGLLAAGVAGTGLAGGGTDRRKRAGVCSTAGCLSAALAP